MSLNHDQKRFLKKHVRDMSTADIAKHLRVSHQDILEYLKDHWRKDKFDRYIQKQESTAEVPDSLEIGSVREWVKKQWTHILFLSILVLITFSYSLFGGFVSDDIGIIRDSKTLGDITYPFTANPLTFLRDFINFIIVSIFGRSPMPYHALNIFLHLTNVILFYAAISLILNANVAFLAAVLFGVHPFISEPVSWISGGVYAQYSVFIFTALIFFTLYVKKKNIRYYIFSLLSAVTALLSSDRGVVPFIILVFVLAFSDIKKYWKHVAAFFAITSVWIIHYLMRIPDRITSVKQEQFQSDITFNPLQQIPVAITSYLELMVWPDGLSIYHSDFLMSSVVFGLRVAIFIALLIVIAISFRKNKYIFFGLSFFLVSLIPTLTPLGISSMVAERYAYLGAAGIFFVFAYGVWLLARHKRYETIVYVVFMIIIGALSVRTIVRTIDWHNEDSLWTATGRTAKYDPVAHMNLGDMHRRHKKFAEAEREFERAIQLSPNNAYAYYNLGLTYTEAGLYDAAIKQYEKAINISPNLWQAYQNMTVTHYKLGNYDQALKYAQKAVEIQSNISELHANVGLIYVKLQNKEEAEKALTKALELDPNNESARAKLAEIFK